MILFPAKHISQETLEQLAIYYEAVIVKSSKGIMLVTPSAIKKPNDIHHDLISNYLAFNSDIQLASRAFMKDTREIVTGDLKIGGHHRNTLVTIGPCSVESEAQIRATAELIRSLGLRSLRAGSFKPRTSPYTFQGMGRAGLDLLDKIRNEYGFSIITEVRDSSHADDVIAFADVVQVGAKAMYDHGILRKCGAARKPVLLKRGFGATLQEFVQAAEFILSGGNEQVILCERGIRTFETKTRFTLDLCGAAYLKENTNLPVILDPSHAMGYAYGVPDLARACMAMDVDGLLIEVHPDPSIAKSDASQQLDHKSFACLFESLKPIAHAVNRNII